MNEKSMAEATAILTAPGAPFEMEVISIRGIKTRVWKNTPNSLLDIFQSTSAFSDRTYLVYEDERMSYQDHYNAVSKLASLLVNDYGVKKGDRVAIAMRNYPEWPVCFWAAAVAGAVVVPLNAWWTGPELEYGLSDSESAVLFADEQRALSLADHFGKLSLNRLVVARSTGNLPEQAVSIEAELERVKDIPDLPDMEFHPEDEATIFYTSGTTGKPKGALGTQRNICANLVSLAFGGARAMLRRGEMPPSLDPDAASEPAPQLAPLLSVPFFHATGCHSTLVANTASGNKLVMMYRWNAERAMELIEREKITSFGGVPSMVWQVLESPAFGERDLSSLQGIGYGGAPAAPELVSRIAQLFPGVVPSNGYGLTETSSVTTLNAASDYQLKPDSVGVPVAVCDVKLMNAEGDKEVAAGEIGELWIKGPNVVKGYWKKPQATAVSFTDGWLHSGDLARIDAEGFVYIVDRAKDMLIRGGENIYCVEVENALFKHPQVMDAAVVGVPHKVFGEEVGAVVQLTPDAHATHVSTTHANAMVDELRAFVGGELAQFMVPQYFLFKTEPLERNANGKILKPQARQELLESLGLT